MCGLCEQATMGDVEAEAPFGFDFRAAANYDA
jgi:acyl-CoA-binding protein